MKVALYLLFGIVSIHGSHTDEWLKFKIQFSKKYANQSRETFAVSKFWENDNLIKKHNLLFESGAVTYKLKMNYFGDWFQHDVARFLNGFKRTHKRGYYPEFQATGIQVPDQIDWRERGAVTGVKYQGQCAACWAFSGTGSFEGQYFLKTNKLIPVSEQQLVDCSGAYGNEGCYGGLMDSAFEYIKSAGGIDTELSYPYEGVMEKCRFSRRNVVGTVTGFVDIRPGDEEALKEAVATIGPISAALDANNPSMIFYAAGTYNDVACTADNVNHAVLIVGYGTDNIGDYWLIKNSWGIHWGMDGYIKIARNNNNLCGIASYASYPLIQA